MERDTAVNSYRLYFAALYGVYLGYVGLFLPSIQDVISLEFSTVVMPALEIWFYCELGLGLWRFRSGRFGPLFLILTVAVPLVVTAVYIIQCYSLYISGGYITVIALENASEGQYIASLALFGTAGFSFMVWSILALICFRHRHEIATKLSLRSKLVFGFLTLLFLAMIDAKSGPKDLIHFQPQLVPMISLGRTYNQMIVARNEILDLDGRKFSQSFLFENTEFPLLKSKVFNEPLPFETRRLENSEPNVIIIFAEGFSARLLSEYGGKRHDLTPNLDALARRSMTVENYFNHTAPTFRGLKGQLVSGYPFVGGAMEGGWAVKGGEFVNALASINHQTLADILTTQGYQTVFISPHPDSNSLNTMLRSLGFSKVHSFETIPDLLGVNQISTTDGANSATDADLFAAASGFLKARDRTADTSPFFLATYNIGTHAFLKVDGDGIPYTPEENKALDRFHNFDQQIGPFLDYFFKSDYADDTILIFTSDHAAFPEPAVVAAFEGERYQPHFVDSIPFLVYSPVHHLPAQFDAKYRTSISLSPSVLHLLGVNDVQNAFLGRSIFESNQTGNMGVAAIGHSFFHVGPDGVTTARDFVSNNQDQFREFVDYIKSYYTLEKLNRVFPGVAGD